MKRVPIANIAPPREPRVVTGFGEHLQNHQGIDYRIADSSGARAGTMVDPKGDQRIVVTLLRYQPGQPIGDGLMISLAPEDARDFATTLVELADELEGAAAEQAAAALRKAAGK